jgi:hypothetical protein
MRRYFVFELFNGDQIFHLRLHLSPSRVDTYVVLESDNNHEQNLTVPGQVGSCASCKYRLADEPATKRLSFRSVSLQ